VGGNSNAGLFMIYLKDKKYIYKGYLTLSQGVISIMQESIMLYIYMREKRSKKDQTKSQRSLYIYII
jgi:hypothetical protein